MPGSKSHLVAAQQGFEPQLSVPETGVLPLDDWAVLDLLWLTLRDTGIPRPWSWPGRRDSNPRHPVPKTGALSTELRPGKWRDGTPELARRFGNYGSHLLKLSAQTR